MPTGIVGMSGMVESKQRQAATAATTSRRGVLRAIGIAGAAAVGITLGTRPTGAVTIPSRARIKAKLVYRLRTRRWRACRACRKHHRYFVARSIRALDQRRAHPGCNCPIVRQKVSDQTFAKWFASGNAVVDLRHL